MALLVGLALTTTVPGAVGSHRADAAGLHRAGVVVDPGDGSGPHAACVWFEEDSISGLELLARSNFDAGLRAFGGLGGAVCSIDGTGCSSDSACLTCGGTQYWAYATANPGDVSFARAAGGAGSRTVTDGAVDGWRWGSGDPPVFRSIDRICPTSPPTQPAPPPPAPPPAAAPAPPPAGPPIPVVPDDLRQPASEQRPTASTVIATTSTTSTTVPGSSVVSTTSSSPTSTSTSTTSTTTATAIGSDDEPEAAVAAAAMVTEAANDGDGGGASVLAIVSVVIAAGLGGTAVWGLRRRS